MKTTLLIGAIVLALAGTAEAQSCGSGDSNDGSDSSSSSDSSFDGGSSSSSAVAEAPPCADLTDVVGYTQCRRFGGWSNPLPPLRFTLFGSARRALIGDLSFAGRARHFEENYAFANTGRGLDASDLLVGGAGFRIDLGLFDYLSIGLEVDGAGGAVSGEPRTEAGVRHTPRSISLLGFGGVVGVAIPVDEFTLRAEVLVGVRAVVLHSETQVAECVGESHASATEAVLEPRVAVEWFVEPTLSLSAFVGTQVLVGGELHGGLALTAHVRAFDGQPGR